MENKEKETMVEVKNNEEQGPIADEKSKLIYRGWKTMPFVIGNETFEKLGAIGTLSNLLVYLTTVFHMSSIQAATIINIFNGTTNFSTVIGAFVSDTYWGRFKTIACASIASFMGLVMIDFTAIFKDLHPPSCGTQDRKLCKGPTGGQIAFLATGLGLLIVGAAGIRPCNFAFGADQFNPKTEAGKKGINSFFNWYFFTFTIAQMLSLTVIVYVQSNVSWSLGFGIPALLMLLSCVLFFMGAKLYVKVKASGSPMTSVAQVLVVAVKKRQLKPLDQPWLSLFVYMPPNSMNAKLPYTHQFRCLDKAAIVTPEDKINADGSAANPWRLCSMQQVEEMKCLVRVLPVWAAAVLYFVVIVQQHTYATFQAIQSNRRLGNTTFEIPAATYYVFLMLTMTIWIPIYDRILVPFLQKRTGREGGITLLQRIGTGIVLSIVCMIISAIVEERRRSIALTKPLPEMSSKGAVSSMSGFWLGPQLAVAGIAEVFTAIGQVEFYYKQFPENMRSIGGSLFFCAMAGSSYVSSLLILIVHKTTEGAATGNWLPEDLNKGRLDYYYYMIAALGVLNFGYFLLIARWYQYKGTGIDDSTLEVEIAEKIVLTPEKNAA